MFGVGRLIEQTTSDSTREDAGLSRTRRGEHRQWSEWRHDGVALVGIEAGKQLGLER